MRKEIEVFTGEVKSGINGVILNSNAIGSCVVVIAYDVQNIIGGMAHIMLPGSAPLKEGVKETKYARNAITQLFSEVEKLGVNMDCLKICLIGGANVLKREEDSIAQDNIDSILEILEGFNFKIIASSLGGVLRRTASLNVETGEVRYSIGDSQKELLVNLREQE